MKLYALRFKYHVNICYGFPFICYTHNIFFCLHPKHNHNPNVKETLKYLFLIYHFKRHNFFLGWYWGGVPPTSFIFSLLYIFLRLTLNLLVRGIGEVITMVKKILLLTYINKSLPPQFPLAMEKLPRWINFRCTIYLIKKCIKIMKK